SFTLAGFPSAARSSRARGDFRRNRRGKDLRNCAAPVAEGCAAESLVTTMAGTWQALPHKRTRELGPAHERCVRWGTWLRETCLEWGLGVVQQCQQWADEGYNACGHWSDQGQEECCDRAPCSWFCDAFYWVAKWVCDFFVCVAKWVCIVVIMVI